MLPLDHIPFQGPDLSALADAFAALGFTVSPACSYTSPDYPDARWNTYYRYSTDGGVTWSEEAQLSAFVSGYDYKLATPGDGYLQPYGDYFELDISSGETVAVWGEGNSYIGPGNVWFARES